MDVITFRAATMHEALRMVRRELGPDAAVLHTREVGGGLWRWMTGASQVEVTASVTVNVPSRLPPESAPPARPQEVEPKEPHVASPRGSLEQDYRSKFREDLKAQRNQLHSVVEDLCRKNDRSSSRDLPESLFHLFTDLIDAEVTEELARELIERVRTGTSGDDVNDRVLLKARLARLIEEEIRVTGPVEINPGKCRVVAMVGPTGVGKTTTIAKLAANYRLREHRRVGLVTVDTYRIAAVEQLRTYADIMDLPMEVVSTPREMRQAIQRFKEMDVVFMD